MECFRKNWFFILLVIAGVFILVKTCQPKPIIKEVTKIEYKDRIVKVDSFIIKEVPVKVYVEKTKTIKGKDSIVYVKTPTDNTIKANQYDVELKGLDAISKLKITTTGELLDLSGTIEYTKKETTTKVTKIVPMSGLFIYGGASVVPMLQRAEIGIDYQIKNAVIIGASLSHDFNFNQTYGSLKLGVRIF